MTNPSPYQPPLPQGPPSLPPARLGIPPVVNVMAIFHLVFAGFGVLAALWALLMTVVGKPLMKLTSSNPELSTHLEAQMALQDQVLPMTITSSLLSLAVAVPMITAGILMLRKRRNGLKWSNVYAISSLVAKGVNLVLTLTIMIPATNRMTEEMFRGSPMPASASNAMSGMMVGGAVGGVLVTCVYPILTLILLNRPSVKAWFDGLAK